MVGLRRTNQNKIKMDKYFILKCLRKVYGKIFSPKCTVDFVEKEPDKASEMIYNLLKQDKPCMIARFGAFELATLVNYLGVSAKHHSAWKYIKGAQPQWWWNDKLMTSMQNNAGFFPATPEKLLRFGQLMMSDIHELDLLGSWLENEVWLTSELHHTQKVHIRLLEPFWAKTPWTRFLKGKRIVVVHPFVKDINSQYENNRKLLFDNPDTLPEFASLRLVRAVQSIGGDDNGFKDWFEALQWMKDEIDKEEYDVCLIGCGAYGFPLAAHVKRTGRQAIHLGGALQLLFGIKGKRWENPTYGVKEWGLAYGCYRELMNDYWVRPGENFKPANAEHVEGACYW